MDLKKKVWLFRNSRKLDIQKDVGDLGTKMSYYGRITHDYLDLWKMKLERII